MTQRLRAAVLLALTFAIGGCAVVRPTGEFLSGRLSVRVDGADGAAPRALNAGFELEGDSTTGQLNLATPLGTQLAQVRWAPGQARLVTPNDDKSFSDLDSLTAQLLGESLPVAALFDWLRGRPWPAASSETSTNPAEPGFVQLGWTVNLANFNESLVLVQRARPPVVSVRAKLDRP